ncbi:MAG: flippase-like domain-containing protein [Acidobacteria bacterium]|nr:flippase-like domain-containing protein [Acidobacteriota bacterium]
MRRQAARLAALVIVLAGVAVVVSRLNLTAIAAAGRTASWTWIAGAALVNLASVVVDAVRWSAILSSIRRVSIVSAVEALLLGSLGNALLPLKLGEGARAWVLAEREGLPFGAVLSTVLLDRAVDASGLAILVVITSLIAPLPLAARRFRTFALAALASVVLLVILAKRWRAERVRARLRSHVTAARVLDGLAMLGHQHRLAGVLTVAGLAWCLRAAVVWCAMRAFHLGLPLVAAATVLITVNLGIAAIAVPANIGVFEVSVAAGLALWRVSGEIALGVGIVLHAAELVPTIALALVARAASRVWSRSQAIPPPDISPLNR